MNSSEPGRALVLKTCSVLQQNHLEPVQFSSHKFVVNHLAACVASGIVCLSNVVLNSMALLVFYKSPKLREKPTHYFLMLLSLADFAVGTFFAPLFAYVTYSEANGSPDCTAFLANHLSGLILVIYTMLISMGMNFERYLGVVHPIYHRTKLTRKQPRRYAFAVFLVCAVLLVLCLFAKKVASVIRIVVVLFWAITTLFIYISIFLATKKHKGRTCDNGAAGGNGRTPGGRFIAEIKLAKTCFLIVFCSLVCYLPYSIATRVLSNTDEMFYVVKVWLVVLGMTNSSINSVLFFWRNGSMRGCAKKIFSKTCLKFKSQATRV